jgi:hypothetical protein
MRGQSSVRVAVIAIVGVLGACQLAGAPVVDPAVAGMGCEQADAFSFSGEASLAALGLADEFGGGRDAQRTGMIWVTAGPVDMNGGFGPAGPGMQPQFERMVCVQWPDGSGMAGPVPAGWQPPNILNTATGSTDAGPPLTLIGLVLAALAIGAISFVAFREPRRA